MEPNLASLFAEQQSSQIDWHGPLYGLYELPTDAEELTLRFRSVGAQLPQGLRLKARGGTLEIESSSASDVILWEDTAPDEVHVRIRWRSKGARSLRVWNAWRVKDVTQAWLGNAGMRVTRAEDGVVTLRSSDGEGDPDFGNLVVEVLLK